jgi:hypothetical protein
MKRLNDATDGVVEGLLVDDLKAVGIERCRHGLILPRQGRGLTLSSWSPTDFEQCGIISNRWHRAHLIAKPCIKGTRITVYDVLEYVAGGMTEDAILNDFPDLSRDDIRAALAPV